MFGPKKVEIRKQKCENCIRTNKNKTECHEIESDLWKDRAAHDGDNP
jgi:hypothetical protein